MRVAILDDYQKVATSLADWSGLSGDVEVEIFQDHIDDEGAVSQRLKDFEIICIMRERTPFMRSLIERLPNLKLLVTSGMRNRSIDLAAAKERSVTVCGTPAAGVATAELTWGLIIGLLRHIPEEDRATRLGAWQRTLGVGLSGKTLGIAGLGRLGSRVARVGLAFGMEVIAWSQNLTEERCKEVDVSLVTKKELLTRSDVLSIHLVLSDRTRGLFGAPELALMKPTAILVNTSRGPIVDEAALVDVLERKAIAGAGLDAFATEPLPLDHSFRRLENTVITPHLGYVEEENYQAYFNGYVDAVRGYLEGKPVNVIPG
ncbi:MAG: D-2-hydroxyacid dehydrogenase family protein [Deltaproteobacteria bacterium]|nr:D-2-hydroxyacid dehydrogenase family protein [Deltaproteobacteria bacterium]